MASLDLNYFCSLCQKNRYVKLEKEDHSRLLIAAKNGLAQVSDIHYCAKGLLSINNLHVDSNWHVRSFSHMELPDKTRKTNSISGIPMPTQQSSINTYKITSMPAGEEGYRLRLMDDKLRISINIGYIEKSEQPLAIFISPNRKVRLEYFDSLIPLRRANRAWLLELVNALEELPPTRLGLFIETIRFVRKNNEVTPSEFEIQQLRTLLSSHKTSFTILPHNYKALRNMTNKYGRDKREPMDKLIKIIEDNPGLNLEELIIILKEDLIFTIYLAILLELEGVLEIHRDLTVSEI